MTKKLYIVLLSIGLCSCASQVPLDDAYYYPDKTAQSTQSIQSTSSSPSAQTKPGPTMEIVSQQDTTITVRIKR